MLVNAETERHVRLLTRSELLGRTVEILLPERLRSGYLQTPRRVRCTGPRRGACGEGCTLFGRRRDGSEFPVEIGA